MSERMNSGRITPEQIEKAVLTQQAIDEKIVSLSGPSLTIEEELKIIRAHPRAYADRVPIDIQARRNIAELAHSNPDLSIEDLDAVNGMYHDAHLENTARDVVSTGGVNATRRDSFPFFTETSSGDDNLGAKRPIRATIPNIGGSRYGIDEDGNPYVKRVVGVEPIPVQKRWVATEKPVIETYYFKDKTKAARLIGDLILRRKNDRLEADRLETVKRAQEFIDTNNAPAK